MRAQIALWDASRPDCIRRRLAVSDVRTYGADRSSQKPRLADLVTQVLDIENAGDQIAV